MPSSPPTDVPKAILYYSPTSVWSATALLGLEEKGYGSDEVDLKIVDLKSGENFSPAYLRINSNGTIPALVVPLERTLGVGIPAKYRALTDTKSVLEFLDKSRSAVSRTHTTSSAPAPALAPATIALSDLSNTIIALVHAVPVNFLSVAATTPDGLSAKANSPRGDFVRNRQAVLRKHIAEDSGSVSDAVKNFWEKRRVDNGLVQRAYDDAGKPSTELSAQAKEERDLFFRKSAEIWTETKNILMRLEADIVGPYMLGDQVSLADLHVGAWLTRVFFVSGAPTPPSGTTPKPGDAPSPSYTGFSIVEDAIHGHTHDAAFTLGPKVRAFWELLKERESWKKVYGEGLH